MQLVSIDVETTDDPLSPNHARSSTVAKQRLLAWLDLRGAEGNKGRACPRTDGEGDAQHPPCESRRQVEKKVEKECAAVEMEIGKEYIAVEREFQKHPHEQSLEWSALALG